MLETVLAVPVATPTNASAANGRRFPSPPSSSRRPPISSHPSVSASPPLSTDQREAMTPLGPTIASGQMSPPPVPAVASPAPQRLLPEARRHGRTQLRGACLQGQDRLQGCGLHLRLALRRRAAQRAPPRPRPPLLRSAFAEAAKFKTLGPHHDAVDASCPLAADCGACKTQFLAYAVQIRHKSDDEGCSSPAKRRHTPSHGRRRCRDGEGALLLGGGRHPLVLWQSGSDSLRPWLQYSTSPSFLFLCFLSPCIDFPVD